MVISRVLRASEFRPCLRAGIHSRRFRHGFASRTAAEPRGLKFMCRKLTPKTSRKPAENQPKTSRKPAENLSRNSAENLSRKPQPKTSRKPAENQPKTGRKPATAVISTTRAPSAFCGPTLSVFFNSLREPPANSRGPGFSGRTSPGQLSGNYLGESLSPSVS